MGAVLGKINLEFECLCIFTKSCTHIEIKFFHRYKVILGWALTLKLQYSVFNHKNIRCFVIIEHFYVPFVYTVCTCSDINLFCLKFMNGTSLFFHLQVFNHAVNCFRDIHTFIGLVENRLTF